MVEIISLLAALLTGTAQVELAVTSDVAVVVLELDGTELASNR